MEVPNTNSKLAPKLSSFMNLGWIIDALDASMQANELIECKWPKANLVATRFIRPL